jgi:hypothetical protein
MRTLELNEIDAVSGAGWVKAVIEFIGGYIAGKELDNIIENLGNGQPADPARSNPMGDHG